MIKVRNLPQICSASDLMKPMKRFTSADKEREGISASAALLGSASQTESQNDQSRQEVRGGPRREKSQSTKEPPALSQKQAPGVPAPSLPGSGDVFCVDGKLAWPLHCRLCLSSGQNDLELETAAGFPAGPAVKKLPANAGDTGLIPGWGRSPEGGNGHPLQCSCLGNPEDRGAWWATVQGSGRSDTADHSRRHRVNSLSEAEWEEEATDV